MKNYAVKVLEDEARLIKKAIKGFKPGQYVEALKVRQNRLKQINEGIQAIKNAKDEHLKPMPGNLQYG